MRRRKYRRDPKKKEEYFDQPALVGRAHMTAAFHELLPINVLQHVFGELSAASMRLTLALERLLVLLTPWNNFQKAALWRL